MSKQYDAVVIGAGPNGLTCATVLAHAGRKTLLVEKRSEVGGLAHVLHDTRSVRPDVVAALRLKEKFGLKMTDDTDVLALGAPGEKLYVSSPPAEDADAHADYREFIDRIRPVLQGFLHDPPVDIVNVETAGAWDMIKRALRVRRLGKRDMLELMRVPPMCVADYLREFFKSELYSAALALPAVAGTFAGPWSPGTAANLLLWEAGVGSHRVVGGGPALTRALEAAARDAGVEIQTGVEVKNIEELDADVVVSSLDPKTTLLELVPPGRMPFRTEHRVSTFRSRGTTAQMRLELNEPLWLDDRQTSHVRIAATLDDIERAFDVVKYGELPVKPALEVELSVDRANVLVHFVPYDLKGGWTDAARTQLGDNVVSVIAQHDDSAARKIKSREVVTPLDLETEYGTSGGHIHHGEHSLDQLLVRPIPEASTYATPVDGLWLCGSGSHPGGGLTCGPGWLAAHSILSA